MAHEPTGQVECTICRRKLLGGIGLSSAGLLAGCLGDDADDADDGDDTDPADDGDDAEPADDSDDQQFPDFDPQNPEFPQLSGTLADAGFHQGDVELLEAQELLDEPRYGNPVPEPPEDESEWLDPDTINFARMASDADIAELEENWAPVMENIEDYTGKDVEYFHVDSRAAAVETMRSERLHVVLSATGAVPYLVNLADAVPRFMGVGAEGNFGYRLWLATHVDHDDINGVEDIAGRDVAHVAEGSFSGDSAPRGFFRDFGIEPGEDYEYEYSGSHDNSARGVFLGDYEVAPLCSTCYVVWMERDGQEEFDWDDLKIIWASDPFPLGPMTYLHNLHPDIVEGLEQTFLEEDYSGTSVEESIDAPQFIEIDYATHWDPILTVHEQTGVEYIEE